ncbi:tetratricopeptide repeat protein [Leptolyngbya sp. CCNP1308]|uniref:tetratricopeptide repeat protein n=1 Tax=Leptolyngbya sp. CCNP1308 TaxID=3110255 RepID=UPI002B20F6EB|nr:tetratricopeptide repeat protein [Leptolyngbya sp. CCNP1308]MEA5447546.1 tetratricopeptide repeat protein [Leptolyngbya sp. CCNP1308]
MSNKLNTIIQRVVGDTLTDEQQQALLVAIQSGQATLATGDRALAVGGNADNAVLITGDRNIVGDRNIIFEGADAEVIRQYLQPARVGIPENLPRSGVVQFVGRGAELNQLHYQLQASQQSTVFAISGMGGVGKTELALQYAHAYKHLYQGGVCWLQAKGTDIGTQVVQFARSRLQLNPSEGLDILEQVGHCWTYWPEGNVLVVIDDVIDYDIIKHYLPAGKPRFKVLLTTRLRLGASIQNLAIEVLKETEALTMLKSLIGEERVQSEIDDALKIYQWLGGLPLGLELVGRYLNLKEDLSLTKMFQRLQKKRLDSPAISDPDDKEMTACLGIANAFELSWDMLDDADQELAYLLCLFAPTSIPWHLVEWCLPDKDEEDLEDLRDQSLVKLHLIQRKGRGSYQLHQLIREFLQDKAESVPQAEKLRETLAKTLARIASKIPESPTQPCILELNPVIPHIEEVAISLQPWLRDDEISIIYIGIATFYYSLATFRKDSAASLADITETSSLKQATRKGLKQWRSSKQWLEKGLEITKKRVGKVNLQIADLLSRLGVISYSFEGNYDKAEQQFQEALRIRRELLDEYHQDLATDFHNLGSIQLSKGVYDRAEELLLRALRVREHLANKIPNPELASTLNSLAKLRELQCRYSEAENLYKASLNIREILFGEDHLDTAQSYNNLGYLYTMLERFSEAEFFYLKSLKGREEHLIENHPDIAQSYNNLGDLYGKVDQKFKFGLHHQQRAQSYYKKALRIFECREEETGETHQEFAKTLSNLGVSYIKQGYFYEAISQVDEAIDYYSEAMEIFRKAHQAFADLLGPNHSITLCVLEKMESTEQLIKSCER